MTDVYEAMVVGAAWSRKLEATFSLKSTSDMCWVKHKRKNGRPHLKYKPQDKRLGEMMCLCGPIEWHVRAYTTTDIYEGLKSFANIRWLNGWTAYALHIVWDANTKTWTLNFQNSDIEGDKKFSVNNVKKFNDGLAELYIQVHDHVKSRLMETVPF